MGLGSATNKKDAESNAAKDFCGFLIGAGIIPADSFPDDLFVSSFNEVYSSDNNTTLVQGEANVTGPLPQPDGFLFQFKNFLKGFSLNRG